MSKQNFDFIIIGQGLAGSVMALELLKRERKILVIDEPEKNRASAIAAGLFNPVTGKMMSRTWKADDLFPFLHAFYKEAEAHLQARFFHSVPLYRPFVTIEEQNEWMGRSTQPALARYIAQLFPQPAFDQDIHDAFGGLLLKQCGYIDTSIFLKSVCKLLTERGAYHVEHFDDAKLSMDDNGVTYGDVHAKKIIYANGLGALQSRFFNTLPLRALKGETLLIKSQLTSERIYNRGVYIVPSAENGIYRVGATYNTKDTSADVSTEAKLELIAKLDALLKIPYELVGQSWGLRPTTPDRRPILGAHRHHPNLVMFNGMGTKGVSLAPYFGCQLADWLDGKTKIEPAVEVNRF